MSDPLIYHTPHLYRIYMIKGKNGGDKRWKHKFKCHLSKCDVRCERLRFFALQWKCKIWGMIFQIPFPASGSEGHRCPRARAISHSWLGVIHILLTRGLIEGSRSGFQCMNCPLRKNSVRNSLSRMRKNASPAPPMSLLSPHYDTEKLYFIANVHRHKRPIRAWNPLNGLLSNTCVSVFQSTVAAQTRLPWAVRRKGDPRRQGGIPEGALDPQVTHRWSGQEHNGAMMPKGTLSPDPSYMRNPAWNSIDGKNLKCAPLIQEHNKCWKLSSLHARPLDGGVFYVSVSSVAPEMASILKKKYVFKEA